MDLSEIKLLNKRQRLNKRFRWKGEREQSRKGWQRVAREREYKYVNHCITYPTRSIFINSTPLSFILNPENNLTLLLHIHFGPLFDIT